MTELNLIFMHVAYGCGSVHLWRRCDRLCTSGCVDGVMISYYGVNWPESNTMLCSEIRQVGHHLNIKTSTVQCLNEFIRIWHLLSQHFIIYGNF